MPVGKSVRPGKWSHATDLYDDGVNSAVWGKFEEATHKCLGVRWNDGYPSQGGNPLWYVEPKIVTKIILLELLNLVKADPNIGSEKDILAALQDFENIQNTTPN